MNHQRSAAFVEDGIWPLTKRGVWVQKRCLADSVGVHFEVEQVSGVRPRPSSDIAFACVCSSTSCPSPGATKENKTRKNAAEDASKLICKMCDSCACRSLFRELFRAAWPEVVTLVRGTFHAAEQLHDNQSHVVALRLSARESE